MKTKLKAIILYLGVTILPVIIQAQPIQVHPKNSHYYLYKGKPTILVTSAELYGAMINKSFDYNTYFKALHSYGMNYTRIYPAFYITDVDKYFKGSPLGPSSQSLIVPWARSNEPGYASGGNKFDLDKWDDAYFARLKDFVAKADAQGIIVEICLFNAQYPDTWPLCPLYYKNNIQGIGKCENDVPQTLRNKEVLSREAACVQKIVQEVNSFDNVILEICDEVLAFNQLTPDEAGTWLNYILDVVVNTEKNLPKKHLIAQMVAGPENSPCDMSLNPNISIIVGQYIWEVVGDNMGGLKVLNQKYNLNKPLEFNETVMYPIQYIGDSIADSRVEAWEFIVGGGASFNQLNTSYSTHNPSGLTPDNKQILSQLQKLNAFINDFNFIEMKPDNNYIIMPQSGVFSRCISQPGVQYAFYLHHSTYTYSSFTNPVDKNYIFGSYKVLTGKYTDEILLKFPVGKYDVSWVMPVTGEVIKQETINVERDSIYNSVFGSRNLKSPEYSVDIALKIKSIAK